MIHRGQRQLKHGFPPFVFCLSSLFVLTSAVQAWPGHNWENWHKVTTWTQPKIDNRQTGKKELVPLLADAGDPAKRINEIKAWETRRAETTRTIQQILGEPTNLKPGKPQVEVLGEQTLENHVRRHIRIQSEPDDWIPAFLLLPRDMPTMRLPVMICLHQTVAQGKNEPCEIDGSPDLAFAIQLVKKGYVCITPDAIGFGERIPPGQSCYHDSIAFYRKHPKWSFMGKMIWDVSRIIDYLETLEFVDPLQIGCIGHSHGAYGSVFAGALEPRIALVIASCGFNTFRHDPSPNRWSHATPLIPQLGTYLPDTAAIPFDWHDLFALMAPRPMYLWYATQDTIFPNTDGLENVFKDVRDVYGLYGAADDFSWRAFNGPHQFPREGREEAYQWLAERSFPVGDLHTQSTNLDDWKRNRELVRKVIRRTIGPSKTIWPPLDLKVVSTEQLPDYERRLMEYTVDTDERVKAYLCVPDRKPPWPGVLVLHQTVPQGKREPAGLEGSPTLAFGADLAGRGYITLSPDSITAGERVDSFGPFDTRGHYLKHPNLSAMGKMLLDARRALDVLAQVQGVDPNRLATIGHSLGAEEALMLAAFDERVKTTVASCGYATFKADTNRFCWCRDRWFSYMPKLRPLFLRGRLPHWDWDNVLSLIAPRMLYQHTTENDDIFPASKSAYQVGEDVRSYWQLYNRPDNLMNVLKPGKHGISPETLDEIYQWLDKHCR